MNRASQPPVGIDLGTTFSVLAYLDPLGRAQTVSNAEGDLTTPSAVLFDKASIVVGKEALKAASIEPDRAATFAKRDVGSATYHRRINGEAVPPEVIQSLVLEKLKRDAELQIGPIDKAVITVPAYFNEPRRKATEDAGQLAGLQVLDIINEPTAAALAFGRREGFLTEDGESRRSERILVYDLGGGTFDVTLMEIDGRSHRAVATAGDVYLGGLDWDKRIVDLIAEEFKSKFRIDPREHPSANERLLREAEEAKRALSSRRQVTVTFQHSGDGLRFPLTRDRFESISSDLLQRTEFTVRQILTETDIKPGDLTRILLIGGSSRMPMVIRMLEKLTPGKIDRSLSPDEAVAHGAAIYAGMLMADPSLKGLGMTVENVSSHDLGVLGRDTATGRDRTSVIIPRNSSLPVSRGKRFRTAVDNQRSVGIRVIEGGDSSGRNATMIGKCAVRGLPPGLPAGTPVEVFFHYAQNGRLTVRARLPKLNRESMVSIDRESGMNSSELQSWSQRLREVEWS